MKNQPNFNYAHTLSRCCNLKPGANWESDKLGQSRDENIVKLFGAQYVSSFDLDCESETIVYALNSDRGRSLHLLLRGRDGKYSSHLLSDEDRSYASLKLVDSGRRLLFLSDTGGDEQFDIFQAEIQGRDGRFDLIGLRNLTPGTDYTISPPISIDASGSVIAFVSDKDGQFATYTLSLRSGIEKRITNHAFSDNAGLLSPDGSRIAVSFSREGQENAVAVFDAESGNIIRRVEMLGKMIDAGHPYWSMDSRTLAFSSVIKDSERIGILNTDSGGLTWITEEGTNCSAPVISEDMTRIAYLREGSVSLMPAISPLKDAGEQINSPAADGLCLDFRLSRKGDRIIMLMEDSRHPPNLCVYDMGTMRQSWLTESFGTQTLTAGFVSPAMVNYASEHDGLTIPALLYRPGGGAGRQAAVVYIHGGPTWRTYARWEPLIQCLVRSGITVVCPNYRGSSGYGKSFRDANRFVMGTADLSDCATAWRYLTENGLASRKKVAVMGESFGGYLTMCALVTYPERWCAGSAAVPFLNWFTEMENERKDLRFWDLQNMGDPSRDSERLRKASPLFFLDRIKAPVQIMAGENDPRCPLSESLQAKERLESAGIPLDFKFYENEGHSFEKMEDIVDSQIRTYNFLLEHLLG
jgi:dipeptidyl aminopeptidase/acylaminoacyl peptidase